MKQFTFKKLALFVCLLCAIGIIITGNAFAQDGISTRKVLIVKHYLKEKIEKP